MNRYFKMILALSMNIWFIYISQTYYRVNSWIHGYGNDTNSFHTYLFLSFPLLSNFLFLFPFPQYLLSSLCVFLTLDIDFIKKYHSLFVICLFLSFNLIFCKKVIPFLCCVLSFVSTFSLQTSSFTCLR